MNRKKLLKLRLSLTLFLLLLPAFPACDSTAGSGLGDSSASGGTSSSPTATAGTTETSAESSSSGTSSSVSSANSEAVRQAAVSAAAAAFAAGKSEGTEGTYEAPDLPVSAFHEDLAEGNEQVKLDLSGLSEGYVGVSAVSDSKLKFQVILGEETYTYDISGDGTPSVFSLPCGDGTYTFRVLENVAEKKYALLYSAESQVTLDSEFDPFLVSCDYIPFDEESECVKTAALLASACDTQTEFVGAVFDYVVDHVSYDAEKAASVTEMYAPDPDETLASGKGICFDFASLAAAMLRSQGIPAKMVFGYVAPDNIYHAWNMFYTEETGWVTVEFQAEQGSWNRLDLTFSAGGADESFIGDGSHYSDVYYY